jgi:hypothetical protein
MPHSKDDAFKKIQEHYGLKTPQQIKMRILFANIMGIVNAVTDNNPENKKLIDQYDKEWRACEMNE